MIETPNGDTLADRALISSLKDKKILKYSFLERASDERQYCSPLINLPVCCFQSQKIIPNTTQI